LGGGVDVVPGVGGVGAGAPLGGLPMGGGVGGGAFGSGLVTGGGPAGGGGGALAPGWKSAMDTGPRKRTGRAAPTAPAPDGAETVAEIAMAGSDCQLPSSVKYSPVSSRWN